MTTGLFAAVFRIGFLVAVSGVAVGFLVKRVVAWFACRYANAPVTIVERRPSRFLAGNPAEGLSETETESTLSPLDSVSGEECLELEHERHVATR
jgi:hypothetical protein